MKRLFPLFLFSIIYASCLFSQSIKKAGLGMFSFSSYPTAPIPLGYKLYAVVDGNKVSYPVASPVAKSFVLKNMKKVQIAESADIVIQISNIAVKSHPAVILDNRDRAKDGSPLSYKAKKRKEISFDIIVTDSSSVIHQDHYSKIETAESKWAASAEKAEKEASLQLSNFTLPRTLLQYKPVVTTKIGNDGLTPVRLFLYTFKNKKGTNYDYNELNESVKTFKNAVDILKADEYDAERFNGKVESAVDTWEREIEDCNMAETDRLTDEMVAALCYNMAVYHIFIKDYEKAMVDMDNCEKTHKGFSNAKELNTLVRSWRNLQRSYEKLMGQSATSIK